MTSRYLIKSIIFVPLIASCGRSASSNEADDQSNYPVSDSVAFAMTSEYELITYNRLIDVETDTDYIDEKIIEAISSSPLYARNNGGVASKAASPGRDTLVRSCQIPFKANVKESATIFITGQTEYSQETELNRETNPLLALYDSPIDLDMNVAKVEIKNGKSRTYNNKGQLLFEFDVPVLDCSEYLEYMVEYQDAAKGSILKDINWLRKSDPNAVIYEDSEGYIVMEQHGDASKGMESTLVRTKFSKDISKNYGFEKYENGHLKSKMTNFFQGSESRSGSQFSPSCPEKSILERLSSSGDGTPMIEITEKVYRVNLVKVNI